MEKTVAILKSIAATKGAFEDFKKVIETENGVRSAILTFNVRTYGADERAFVEFYLEAEIENHNSVCWALELAVGESHLVLEADVRVDWEPGQDLIREVFAEPNFALERIATLSDLTKQLFSLKDIETARRITEGPR